MALAGEGVSPVRSLTLSASVPPARTGGLTCAEAVNINLLKESSTRLPGSKPPESHFRKLQLATDLALRVTKKTALVAVWAAWSALLMADADGYE